MNPPRRTLSKSSDYLDALATALRDLGGPTTIPRELTQNADDAGNATIIRFTVTDEALTVWNNGTFTDCGDDGESCPLERRCDLHAFRRFAGRAKADDATTTGAFGVGFTSVYQITDAPELLYNPEHWRLNEMAPPEERLRACAGACGRDHGEPGTTFVLPWARALSPLRTTLEVPPVDDAAITELEAALLDDARRILPFLRHITAIEVRTRAKPYRVSRRPTDEGFVIADEDEQTPWLALKADFAGAAGTIIAGSAGLIKPERPTDITIAVPVGGAPHPGVLYATLPTQTPSGLPGHVNASFYPKTDRKSVRFENGYDSEWNRAVITAVGQGLAACSLRLAESIGITAFWEFLGAIEDFDRRADSDQPNHASTYLAHLRQVIPGLPVVETMDGSRAAPRDVLLPAETELYEAAQAISQLDLPVVAEHLHRRLHTNNVYTSYEMRQLSARHIVERLASKNITKVFDPKSGPLNRDQVLQLLAALERLPGRVANVEGIDGVALVPCRNGLIAPASEVVWPASKDDGTLFEVLVDGLLIADVDTVDRYCPSLRDSCTPLDVDCAVRVLQEVEHETLAVMAEELLDWLNRNLTSTVDRATREQVARLPIFPTATGFEALTRLSLPNDFRDPIAVASLVADKVAREYHKLLADLGARPLDVVEYFRVHAVPAANSGRLSVTKAPELLRLIAAHQEELAPLLDMLASAELVPCTDGLVHSAPDVHLPSREISMLAPGLPVADTAGIAPAVLDWLGVQRGPSDRALAVAAERLAIADADPDVSVVEAVLKTLHARDHLAKEPPDFLTSQRWLPLKRGGRAKPSAVLPSNARQLYGTQGAELGLPADMQGRYFDQLKWLGMPSVPPITTIVDHLRYCAENGLDMHSDVYRVLSNNTEHQAVRNLRGTPCVYVGGGRFVQPATAFWQQPPFGRWGTTLHESWLPYKPFFDAVGVKQEAGATEIAEVLRSILREYGTDPLDEEGAEAVHGCWTRLSDLMDTSEAASVLAAVGRIRSTMDPRGVLARPDELYFEDSRMLHKRFPQLAHNVIPRVRGTWPALTGAGVRRVEELIKARLVNVSSQVDTEVPARIAARMSALRRVFDDERVLDALEGLEILRTAYLQVSYRAELFGHPYEIGPEVVDAVYLPDEHQLVYAERAPDRALAREIARAMTPDDDPGPLAMRLEPVLTAGSVDEAHRALDDFGIAKLDTTEHESVWSPTTEAGEDVNATGHPPAEGVGHSASAGTTQEDVDGTARADVNGHRAAPASGTAGGGLGGGRGSSGDGKARLGGPDPRTGRQTRLRSYVVETDEDEDVHGTIGDEAPDLSPVDRAGVARVLDYEQSCGRVPREMTHSNPGFDIESFDKRGDLERRIEIKSTGGAWSTAGVMLSRRQHHQAVDDGDLFWLYVVENALDDGFRIYRIQNPASRIDYFGFDGGWKAIAEPDLERDNSGTPIVPSSIGFLRRSPGQIR